jgi:TIR domain
MVDPTARPKLAAFLSYSHEDAALVTTLFHLLRSVGSVFLDTFSLMPGDDWRRKIESAIEECEVFFVFWCWHAAQSKEVHKEYTLALKL